MKKTQILIAGVLALALTAATSLHAAEEGQKEGKATVRAIHGTVQYLDNASWLPVKVNMKFAPGVTIRTGKDGSADISVNGTASAVRLTNDTTLQIPSMSYVGSTRDGDTTTMLNLVSGSVLGNVKKITANSRYEITTPHGVAGIRGTDFQVEAIPTRDGTFTVRFSSITGVITVSAVVNGTTITHTLTTGTSWEIGHEPTRIEAQLLAFYQSEIHFLVDIIEFEISHLPPHAPPPPVGQPPTGNPPSAS